MSADGLIARLRQPIMEGDTPADTEARLREAADEIENLSQAFFAAAGEIEVLLTSAADSTAALTVGQAVSVFRAYSAPIDGVVSRRHPGDWASTPDLTPGSLDWMQP